ncbi:hypothetical protein SAMN05444162_3045 [Paenibacillaceae bacterium GAS479]|nr:hypothetical protein SAMN05444162_3045 [Paenibacillaceae bacterium GAS479]
MRDECSAAGWLFHLFSGYFDVKVCFEAVPVPTGAVSLFPAIMLLNQDRLGHANIGQWTSTDT